MLIFYTGGEQETEDDLLAVNLSARGEAVSPEYVMESMIDTLIGMAEFLQDNRSLYRGILADFSVELPEGHDAKNYINVPEILKNMEHQKLVEFYDRYCGPDCFANANENEGSIWYSFMVYPPAEKMDTDAVYKYYREHIL